LTEISCSGASLAMEEMLTTVSADLTVISS
jgi:hypothetical protein